MGPAGRLPHHVGGENIGGFQKADIIINLDRALAENRAMADRRVDAFCVFSRLAFTAELEHLQLLQT